MGKGIIGGLKSWSRRKMALVAVAGAMAISAVPTVGLAWMSWDGIDPIISNVAGKTMNIYIEWPAEFTCQIDQDVRVKVRLPQGTDAVLTSESMSGFPCDGVSRVITTTTDVTEKHNLASNVAIVRVDADADMKAPIRVHVSLDGSEVAVIAGDTNGWVEGTAPLG